MVDTVRCPISGDDVHFAFAIQVAGSDAVPPTNVLIEAQFFSDLMKFAPIIREDPNRPPLARQNQFRKTIVIQIAENSAADEPDVGKNLAVSWVLDELPLVVAQKLRGGGGGITTGDHSSTDKDIQISITIHVGHCERTGAGTGSRERGDGHRFACVPTQAQYSRAIGLTVFVV